MAAEHTEREEKEWIQVQKRTFTKWLNQHLKKKGFKVLENMETDWEDGIMLMNVVNALYDIPIPKYNPAPKMRPHKLDNLAQALQMVETAQIKTNFLKSTQLIDHDLKMILGMVWAIILDYAIKGISVDEMTAKEGLLLWVRKKTAGYNHVDPPGVRDFSQSWKSGMALCALIHRHRPNLIPYDTLDPKNAAHNLELAFSVAEKDLGIARLLDVADLTAVERPDERSVMTYISEFFHRFASENVKENAARRVAKFLQFAREVEQSQHEYERRARDLIAWANEQHRVFHEQKFGETLEEVQAAQAQFRNYMVKVKPEKVAERLDVEVLFAEIQTNLHVNNRRPYVPDDSVKPDAVGQAFEQLNGAEGAYGRALRDSRFRFIKKREFNLPQEKIDEFTAAFKHFDKDGNQTLDKKEFKAALQGLGIPFKDDAAFDKVFASVANGAPQITLEQYIAYNVSLAQDKDSPDQIIESFKVMANDADTIAADQLHMPPLTQEETQYLQTHMPKADESHFDYKAYVQASFVDN